MKEREWKLCLNCEQTIYDKEDEVCFSCRGSDIQTINRSQLIEMKEKNPNSGIIIMTRYWGDIYQ